MSPHLLDRMPPTATVVDDLYDVDPAFASIANAADTAMVEVLREDFTGDEEYEDDLTLADWAAYYGDLHNC